jgi:hypothetical protein
MFDSAHDDRISCFFTRILIRRDRRRGMSAVVHFYATSDPGVHSLLKSNINFAKVIWHT